MRILEDVDTSKPIFLTNYHHDLDKPVLNHVMNCRPIELVWEEATQLFAWAKATTWRAEIEKDLQSISQDGKTGEPFLTAHLPLVAFRESFLAGGRHLQDERTQNLFEKLRALTRDWREAGGDTVRMDGYLRHLRPSRRRRRSSNFK